ncbi:phytoene/squalene synthase family protein [Haloarculaceae archaeon H-GB2-1]|nr:phytoene/squalene synthase family protein [Haloarculaceae archaeon H-GB1-1]MEA5386964.1 phytoene/squalene synthase family protein [Haloarculaceae archaeon H-GB11]MEA5408467.1 phytoene/squalene synthase family protein [Haloarculaceae archaeon H-GB2-1]
MVERTQLTASKEIQRRTGKTFHVATRVLPQWMREATYVLYALFRMADEVVDSTDGPPPEEQRAELERIRAAALGEAATDDPVLTAFCELRERYGIPDEEVEVFIDAMAMDVEATDYETYADLRTYLRGSSVAVGYMMLELMDPPQAETARPHAKALGEAFQLTNFLRDVREDVLDYDRVYLPRETLERHDVARQEIERLSFSPRFADAMADEMARTEDRYREGVAGIQYLPEDCQFGVVLAAVLYAEHHRRIRERGFDVLSERPTLTMTRRLTLAARTWLRWQVQRDPEAVFYAVGAIDPNPNDGSDEFGDGPSPESVTRPARKALDQLISAVRPRLWG